MYVCVLQSKDNGNKIRQDIHSLTHSLIHSLTHSFSFHSQSYLDAKKMSFKEETESLPTFETSKNGLTFLDAPPYFNNLTPVRQP